MACGGQVTVLGTLGNREHFRCRDCGIDGSRKAKDTENVFGSFKEATGVDLNDLKPKALVFVMEDSNGDEHVIIAQKQGIGSTVDRNVVFNATKVNTVH